MAYTLHKILQYVDPLRDKDRKIRKYATAFAVWRLGKQTCSHGNDWTTTMRNGVFCAVRAEMLEAGQVGSCS
jgi:hypothetical protein